MGLFDKLRGELVDIIEDDLILLLPMVPRHEEGQCSEHENHFENEHEPETHRPFSDLARLTAGDH